MYTVHTTHIIYTQNKHNMKVKIEKKKIQHLFDLTQSHVKCKFVCRFVWFWNKFSIFLHFEVAIFLHALCMDATYMCYFYMFHGPMKILRNVWLKGNQFLLLNLNYFKL